MVTRLLALLLAAGLLVSCGRADDANDAGGDQATGGYGASDSPSGDATTGASPSTQSSAPSASPSTSPAAPGTQVVVRESEFGPMLFDATGQAIYLFAIEDPKTRVPECYDACAVAWPPVLTKGAPVAGPGVDAAKLGTTPRKDGTQQVTYGGWPLYFYVNEGKGEVKCHDVFLNGGKWYVVQPDGTPAPPG